MVIISNPISVPDLEKPCFQIEITDTLFGDDCKLLRDEVEKVCHLDYDIVYLNVKNVQDADLSGVNEIIHCNFILKQANKKLIVIYKKKSAIEKWILTTSLDDFVATAIIP